MFFYFILFFFKARELAQLYKTLYPLGPRFDSQDPHYGLQVYIALILGHLTLSSGL